MTTTERKLDLYLDYVMALLGLRVTPTARRVPILGVEGSGKTSLIVTAAQYASSGGHGNVPLDSLGLFNSLQPYVVSGRPLPATVGYTRFKVELTRVHEPGGGWTDVNLHLSSDDIPGQDFRRLCDAITRRPDLSPDKKDPAGVLLGRFRELLAGSDGLIFVVDLLRTRTPQEFTSDPRRFVGEAYADQVQPIMDAIVLAARLGVDLARKPIFFVFTKPDLHGLDMDSIRRDFDRLLAIPLGALRAMLVNIGVYSVQCACWGQDQDLAHTGVDRLLSDLAHALGAVEPRR